MRTGASTLAKTQGAVDSSKKKGQQICSIVPKEKASVDDLMSTKQRKSPEWRDVMSPGGFNMEFLYPEVGFETL